MAATKTNAEGIFQSVLVNYLVSQARTVEARSTALLWAVLERNERLAGEVFLTEPRINEMEILIDEHAIRLLRQGNLADTDVRLVVAALKINNDLERMGDLAVNLSERADLSGRHGRSADSSRTGAHDDGSPRDGLEMPGRADLPKRGACRPGA